MEVCKCGSTKIENRDWQLCATCNKARIKGEAPAKESKVYSMKRTPINQVSTKKHAALKEKDATFKELAKREIKWCETCGSTNLPLSHSHTLSVGQFAQYEADPFNIVMECFGGTFCCHDLWEHNKAAYQKLYPKQFAQRIAYIRSVEPLEAERILSKLN